MCVHVYMYIQSYAAYDSCSGYTASTQFDVDVGEKEEDAIDLSRYRGAGAYSGYHEGPVCVVVCYRVLECVGVCCSVLECVAVCCSVLQCVAVCCSVLQCVAACCSVLSRYSGVGHPRWPSVCLLQVCCSVLQCVVVCV